MADKDFDIIMKSISNHLKREKTFVQNHNRINDVVHAMEIAKRLFPNHVTEIKDDPLQTGALILQIDCTEMCEFMEVSGEEDVDLFCEMVCNADNFEFYQHNGNIRFAAVFNGARKLVK